MAERNGLEGKLMTVGEAVARFVRDGSQVAVGGFTINRNPMALVYEIARRRVRDLHLVVHSNGQALDVLVGAGCVSRLEIAYGGNGRFAPTCFRFRKAVERGELLVEDYTNNQMTLRFLAGALGVPFIPSKSGLGTDVLAREGFPARGPRSRRASPRTRRTSWPTRSTTARTRSPSSPPSRPTSPCSTPSRSRPTARSASEASPSPTSSSARRRRPWSSPARRSSPASYLKLEPDRNSLPPFLVDAVVPVAYGAHPTACPYFYDYDPAHLNLYKAAAKDDEQWLAYLEEWVYGIGDWDEYLDKVGGAQLVRIRANTVAGYAPGLDRR